MEEDLGITSKLSPKVLHTFGERKQEEDMQYLNSSISDNYQTRDWIK